MSTPIVCKPTPWFLLRAAVMFLMFGTFTALFFLDGTTGYRKKNQTFFLYKTFEFASKELTRVNSKGTVSADDWKEFAAKQTVQFPEPEALPKNLKLPMPWPAELQDFERVQKQWNVVWREYSREHGLDSEPAEHPYTAQQIREQIIFGSLCAALTAVAAFFLIRTWGRSISADDTAITAQNGKRVPFADLKKIDLRKWDTKGIAFMDYEGSAGKGRIRLDGLTYGGFKKDQGEPAEKLMRHVRAHFSGEILEYAVADAAPADTPGE